MLIHSIVACFSTQDMIPTNEFIKQKFIVFNTQFFDSKLPMLPFRATKARSYLAQIACKKERSLLRGTRFFDFTFRFSTCFDLTETELEDIILHEMIHYYILYNNIHDTSAHGKIFRSMMNDINRRYNRNIRVSYKLSNDNIKSDKRVRRHLVCISHFADGRCGITVASRSRIFQLWENIPKIKGVAYCEWFLSRDTFFNRYPRSLTPRIYIVKEEDFSTHIVDALPLEKSGDTIHPRTKVISHKN